MALIERNTVTPGDLVQLRTDYPCLHCLSETQLLMVEFITLNFLYNRLNQTDVTPVQMLQEMGCQNCLSDKQALEGLISKFIFMASELGYVAQAGLEDASCTQCADPHALKIAIASLLAGIVGEQIVL